MGGKKERKKDKMIYDKRPHSNKTHGMHLRTQGLKNCKILCSNTIYYFP